jgi:hypothetical protein
MKSLFQHNRAVAFGQIRRGDRVTLGLQLGRHTLVVTRPKRWEWSWRSGGGRAFEIRYRADLWVFGLSWGRGSLLFLFGPLAVRIAGRGAA